MAPKRIPKYRILQHFCSLPEAQRIQILRNNLSEELITTEASNSFYPQLLELREKPENEAKAFLKKYFGDTPEHLKKTIDHGNVLIYLHNDLLGARTDIDKLYAQVCGETMISRLRIFYDDLYEKDKLPHIREAFSRYNSLKNIDPILNLSRNFAPGKSADTFLEDVKKTMNLEKQSSMMEELRAAVPADDPERKEKLQCLAQQFMIYSESGNTLEDLAGNVQGRNWKKNFNIQKILTREDSYSRIGLPDLLKRIRTTMNEVPETEEEKAFFKEAALETCKAYRDYRQVYKETDDPDQQELLKLTGELQEEVTAEAVKKPDIKDLSDSLATEYNTLKKTKTGWFLSSTNSPEYNNMMKHLKLFNAKLDILRGDQPKETLTAEELKTVNETGVGELYANARQGCYNYGTLKTKSGTGSILHTAGTERFKASMNMISKLGDLGKKLHLDNSATAVRDNTQLEVLKHRRDGAWLKENIEDAVAKTICTQAILNERRPEFVQRSQLEGDALKAQMDKIKAHKGFRKMMGSFKSDRLADAVINGGNDLYDLYNAASKAVKEPGKGAAAGGPQKSDSVIKPEAIKKANNNPGLVPGRR